MVASTNLLHKSGWKALAVKVTYCFTRLWVSSKNNIPMTCKCCCFYACFWRISFFVTMSWKHIGCSYLFRKSKIYLFLPSKVARLSPLETPFKKAVTFSPSCSLDIFLTFVTLFIVLFASFYRFLSLKFSSIALLWISEGFIIGFIVTAFATFSARSLWKSFAWQVW